MVRGQDDIEGGSVAKSDKPSNADDIKSLSDGETVTFAQLAAWLGEGVKPNTIAARWFPQKVAPAYIGLSCPPLKVDGKLSGFGAKAIARWYCECHTGVMSYEAHCESIQAEYAASEEVIRPEVMTGDDTDRHRINTESIDDAIARQRQNLGDVEDETMNLFADIASLAVRRQTTEMQAGKLSEISEEQRIYLDELKRLKEEEERKIREQQIREKARQDFLDMMGGRSPSSD